MADKNFIVKNGLEVGGQEVISSSGVVTSAALGGQTLASTDSPTFNNLTLTNDIEVGGDLNLTGDLNITGDVNSLSVTDLDVTDQTITLGAGQVESASGGSGIVVAGSNASLLWDETNDVFDFNKGVTSTGNVGIGAGATSPSNLLHVQESQASSTLVFLKNASATAASVLALDTGGTGTNTKIFDAQVGGTSKFMIYGDGSAEIARPSTSQSTVPLLVLSGPQGIMRLGDGQSDNGGPHGIQFDYYGVGGVATDGMSMYYRTDPEHISFEDSTGINGNEVMVIERTGNVGIGTDEPDFKLHVNGSNLTGGIFVEDSSAASSSPIIKVRGKRSDANKSQSFSGGLVLDALYTGGLAPDAKHIGTIYFGTNHTDGTAANIAYSASISGILEGAANSATDMPTGLVFYTGDAGTALGTSQTTYGTERMRIDHDGQVGINVNDPSYKLHTRVTSGNNRSIIVAENTGSGSQEAGITVKNSAGEGRFVIGGSDHVFIENATEGKDLRFLTFPSGGSTFTEAMRILHNGRVGIGEDNPNANLHIGASAATGNATNPALQIGGATTYRLGMFTTAEGGVIDNANGDDGLQFHTKNAGEAVRITADGNLQMIGQTSTFASPGFTYHTNNYLYCRGGSAGLILSDDSGINTVQIIDGSAGYINFETGDGSSRMRINSSRIEIDPTNDLYKFTYNGSSFNEGLRMGAHSNGYSIISLGAGSGDSGSVDGQWTIARHPDSATSEDNKFSIRHDGDALAFNILKNGNVGIGVDAPSQKLEVDGRIKLGGMMLQNTAGGGSIGFNRNPADGSDISGLSLRRFQINGPGTTSGDYLEIQSYNSSGTSVGNIRIQDGKLGIGTTASERLHIFDSSGNGPEIRMQNSTSSHYIRAYNDNWNFLANATNTAIAIKNSGAVENPVQLTAGGTQYDTEGNLICYGSGQNSLILQTPDNTSDRGIAFRNSGGAYIANIYVTNRGSNLGDMIFGVSNATETLVTDVNERMRISKEGNVGIGGAPNNDYTGYLLQLNGSSQTFMSFGNSTTGYGPLNGLVVGNDGTGADIYQRENQPLRFHTNNTERMRILNNTDNGTVCINATDTDSLVTKLWAEWDTGTANRGPVIFTNPNTGTTHRVMTVNTGGNSKLIVFDKGFSSKGSISTNGTSTAYNTTSDYRLKENISYTWDATTRLKQLKPARFNFIEDETNTLMDGFIAHEVSNIVPEAVVGEKDAVDDDDNPIYQEMDAAKLIPLLVKTIQEMEARITELEG